MSSAVRSPSGGIRDLRAMFEKSNSNGEASPDTRGRSPGGNSQSRSPSAQKIKSSFVNVEKPGESVTPPPPMGASNATADRRGSFSFNEVNDKGKINELKKTVSQEQERRKSKPGAVEVVPEEATAPAPKRSQGSSNNNGASEGMPMPIRNRQSEHPDKAVSAVEDESASLTSADPKAKNTKPTSLGSKSGPSQSRGTTAKSRPSNVATTALRAPAAAAASKASIRSPKEVNRPQNAQKALSNRLSMASSSSRKATAPSKSSTAKRVSDPMSPPAKSGPRSPTVPVSLPSHLTAQTASSSAKHDSDKKDPRSTANRKPIEASSHLMAPTTSSKAKHEEDQGPAPPKAASKPASTRTSLAPRASIGPPPSKTKPRTSLAHSTAAAKKAEPRGAATKTSNKPSSASSEGFMARMMRPTTASASKHSSEVAEAEASQHQHAQPSGNRTDRAGSIKKAATSRPSAGTQRISRGLTDSERPKKDQPRASTAKAYSPPTPPKPASKEEGKTESTAPAKKDAPALAQPKATEAGTIRDSEPAVAQDATPAPAATAAAEAPRQAPVVAEEKTPSGPATTATPSTKASPPSAQDPDQTRSQAAPITSTSQISDYKTSEVKDPEPDASNPKPEETNVQEPKASKPQASQPENLKKPAADSKISDSKASKTKAAENKAPKSKGIESKMSGNKPTEGKLSERKAPDTQNEKAKAPDSKTEGSVLESKAPASKESETKAPETNVSEVKVAENDVAHMETSETKVLEEKVRETKEQEGKVPETKEQEEKVLETNYPKQKLSESTTNATTATSSEPPESKPAAPKQEAADVPAPEVKGLEPSAPSTPTPPATEPSAPTTIDSPAPAEAAPATSKKSNNKKKSKKSKAAQASSNGNSNSNGADATKSDTKSENKPQPPAAANLVSAPEPLSAPSIPAPLANAGNETEAQTAEQRSSDSNPALESEEPKAAAPVLPLCESGTSAPRPKTNGNSTPNGSTENGSAKEEKEMMAETPRFGGAEIH